MEKDKKSIIKVVHKNSAQYSNSSEATIIIKCKRATVDIQQRTSLYGEKNKTYHVIQTHGFFEAQQCGKLFTFA